MSSKGISQVVNISVRERNLDILKEYLSTIPDVSQIFNVKTISSLLEILKRDFETLLEKTIQVTCILTLLLHFVESEIERQKWEELAGEIGELCEEVFAILDDIIIDEYLIQQFIEIASSITEHGEKVSDTLLKYLITPLMTTSSSSCSFEIRLPIVGFLGSLLQKSSKQARREVIPSVAEHLEKLSNQLISCGDYETQVSIVEIIARTWTFIKDNDKTPNLFSDCTRALQIFKRYCFVNFDPECRLFLNEFNEMLGDKRLVFSIPSIAIYADSRRLEKPEDPIYKEFWVDFNINTRSVSFYYFDISKDSWELMSVKEGYVFSVVAKNSTSELKNGRSINTAKIEFTLKNDMTKVDLPNVLTFYFCKSRRFVNVVEPAIKEIFQNKYRSEVVYFREQSPHEDESGLLPYVVPFDFNETAECINNFYFDKRDPEKRTVTQHSIVKESTELDEGLTDSEVSFSQHIEQEANESIKTFETERTERKKSNANKIGVNSEINKTEENVSCSKTLGVETANGNIKNCTSPYKTVCPEKSDRHSLSENYLNSKKDVDTNSQSVSKLVPSINVSLMSNGEIDEEPGPQNSKERLRKRSYSSERSHQEGQIISYQDNCVEVLACKLRKKEQTVDLEEIGNQRECSFSSGCNKYNEYFQQTENSISKINNVDNQITNFETNTKFSKQKRILDVLCNSPQYLINSAKKLKALNKTPENSKELFVPLTVYSDLSSAGKNKRVGKTYGRAKPKSKRRKVAQVLSSESDSDYVPEVKTLKENNIQQKRVRRNTRKQGKESFVRLLTNSTVDAIRDVKPAKEKKLMPSILDESDIMKSRELDMDISVMEVDPDDKKYYVVEVDENKGKQTKRKRKLSKTNRSKKPQCQKESINKSRDILTYRTTCDLDFEPPEYDGELRNDDFIEEILNNPFPKDTSLIQTSFKMNEIMQFGKFVITQINNEIKKIKNLALKEREMNFASFDFKAQTSCNAMYTQCQKMEIITKNLLKVKNLLDATYCLQEDVALQFKTEITQLEESKQTLIKNINKIGKSETSKIAIIFQKMGRCIKNIIFSFIQRNTKKNTSL